MQLRLVNVDYHNDTHGADLVSLLNDYAQDPMGGAEPLSEHTKQNLVAALQKVPDAFSVIAYVDDKPAALINCFQGFSTFKCKPIVNIHDVTVRAEYRGKGLSHKLLDAVQVIATQRGACKLTLEVLEGNKIAQQSYEKFGFKGYELDPEMGKAIFWEKSLHQNS